MMEGEFFAALIKVDGKMIVMTDSDGKVAGFTSLTEGLRHFESAYGSGHRRGYESSMSACMSFILFTPSIVKFSDVEDLKKILQEPLKLVTCSSVAGRVDGIICSEHSDAEDKYKSGTTPDLLARHV